MADGVRIVFDYEDRIAEIAQTFERPEQAVIVTLVQADARLIQNIENSHQPRADLRGQPDALRLATAERAAFAIQR